MNSKPAWACALSTFILAGTAHAQAPPPGWIPPPNLAHISIQAPPSTQLEVVPSDASADTAAVAQCTEYCDFWALPGRYTLYARDHSTGQRNELSLRIKKSSRFEFEAGDDGVRTVGLFLGIGGSISLGVGLAMFGLGALDSSDSGRDAAAAGLGLMLAGVIATPAGWSMYASNRTRLTRVDGSSYTRTETASQVRLGVVGVGLGGFGLGGVGTF